MGDPFSCKRNRILIFDNFGKKEKVVYPQPIQVDQHGHQSERKPEHSIGAGHRHEKGLNCAFRDKTTIRRTVVRFRRRSAALEEEPTVPMDDCLGRIEPEMVMLGWKGARSVQRNQNDDGSGRAPPAPPPSLTL